MVCHQKIKPRYAKLSLMDLHFRSDAPVILDGLTVQVGTKVVLKSLSHSFPPSSLTVILGPNGVGKTTLLRTLAGILRPKAGSAFICGHPAGSVAAKSKVGYLAESNGLYDRLSAMDNLLFHARLRRMDGGAKEEALALLEKFGLDGLWNAPVRTYSKGMKQKLALARTLMGSPQVLLLDEPTSGLDPDGSEVTIGILKRSSKEGATVIMTTHNSYLARRMGGSVLLLKDGQIRDVGSFEEVLKPYRRLRVKLLDPVDRGKLKEILDEEEVRVTGSAVDEFEVVVRSKEAIPELIRGMVKAELKLLSVEPGEVSYEMGE